MTIALENFTDQGEAAFGSYASAALITSVSGSGKPQGHFHAENLGTAGYWYIKFKRTTGPTTSVYSIKLGPKESRTFDNPPIGDIWGLADGSVNGNLSWSVGYAT